MDEAVARLPELSSSTVAVGLRPRRRHRGRVHVGPALSLTRRLCSKERELVSAEFLRCDGGHYMRTWLH